MILRVSTSPVPMNAKFSGKHTSFAPRCFAWSASASHVSQFASTSWVDVICATANPVEVVIAETEQGRGILGVIDGFHTKGVETDDDIAERKGLLRRFGYKVG